MFPTSPPTFVGASTVVSTTIELYIFVTLLTAVVFLFSIYPITPPALFKVALTVAFTYI